MKTAHISLDDETYELLRQESRTRKVPISSVIRESIIQRTEAKSGKRLTHAMRPSDSGRTALLM
jgi:predicted CopG family antitoxin